MPTKILAVLMAVMMVAALSVVALATGSTLNGGVDGDGTTAVTSLVFTKQIKVFNPENIAVRLPAITYTYTITPVTVADPAPTVTDSTPDTVTVLSGVTVADVFNSASASVSFAQSETVNASSSGVLTSAKDVTFTPLNTLGASVTRAGIYRYQVTETTNPTKAAAGVEEPDGYATTKYLDVYVGNVAQGTIPETYKLQVVGFVLFDSADAAAQNLSTTNASTQKSDGWGAGEGTSATNTDIDEYHTTNLTLTKTTSGSLADKSHRFPISITLTKAAGLTNDVTVDVTTTGALATGTSATMTLGSSVAFGASLKDGENLVIKGIPYKPDATTPAYATITTLTEDNDTTDTYTQTIALTSVTGITEPAAATAGGSTATFTCSSAALSDKDTAASIGITNTMSEISPTGIVMRFAPFAIIFAAGCMLLLVSRKTRKNED